MLSKHSITEGPPPPFWGRVSLYSPGWYGMSYVDQVSPLPFFKIKAFWAGTGLVVHTVTSNLWEPMFMCICVHLSTWMSIMCMQEPRRLKEDGRSHGTRVKATVSTTGCSAAEPPSQPSHTLLKTKEEAILSHQLVLRNYYTQRTKSHTKMNSKGSFIICLLFLLQASVLISVSVSL